MLANATVNVSALCNSSSVALHVSLCGQQNPEWKRAIRLVYPPFFSKLHSSSNPTNKNLTGLSLKFGTALSR